MGLFVEEFLYRGRDPDSGEPGAWHVVIGEYVKGAGSKHLVKSLLSMEQAQKNGHALPEILSDINANALIQAEEAARKLETLQIEHTELLEEHAQLQTQVAQVNTALEALQAQYAKPVKELVSKQGKKK